MHRQIAGRLTGSVTKWVVLVLRLLVAAGAHVVRAATSVTSGATES